MRKSQWCQKSHYFLIFSTVLCKETFFKVCFKKKSQRWISYSKNFISKNFSSRDTEQHFLQILLKFWHPLTQLMVKLLSGWRWLYMISWPFNSNLLFCKINVARIHISCYLVSLLVCVSISRVSKCWKFIIFSKNLIVWL